ncbi:Uncharacterized protein DBV15_10036 [Temnothorax longispinosus]|uniref:t-SNARE coiled-coil homology domain-containing protein n=1 Tax=Temnothorax longispinosus TaxID=300112 RepID=A0A4S2JRG3_9HYME|nr:Uncharacterized protein DBV15_10036 [Temnothorax longispinosus]
MSARRRHVVGPVANRDLACSGGSRHYYDEDGASGRLLSEETVDFEGGELPTTTMTSRDRTNEFANAIRSMQSRAVARTAVNLQNPRRARQIQSYSNFMMIAKNIGKNIASTYAKLEKLALLAKRKSIFNDRQMEIEELTNIIKTDLKSLNLQIGKLQELGKSQRESYGSSPSHHIASHSSSINMREEQSRRQQFTQGSLSTMLPPSVVSGKQGSLLLQEEISSNSVAIDLEPAMSQQLQQQFIQDDTDAYVQSRAETMQNIESTIVELGGIFQQLAHMVKEQEEMVERIDSNIEDTELNVEAAHTEILKYFQSVTSNRWLMIKIFAVLIFFFIFFVVFLA